MALPISYNIRNLRVRWRVTLLAIGGIALVVAVFIVLIAMANGFRVALRATGSPGNGIITQRGSGSELTSGLGHDTVNRISVDSRVKRDAQGRPMASPELVVVAGFPRRSDGLQTNVLVRGVTPMALLVRSNIKVVEGRGFTPGLYEVIVGKAIHNRIANLDVGKSIKLQRRDWQIVGIFTAEGSGFESEVWGDVQVMSPAFNRNGYQSLTVRLADPAGLKAWDEQLRRDPQMQVQLEQEQKYYDAQSGNVAGPLMALAAFVAVVMGIGAVFGAMNTMYAIVAARTREIGTLRALGFSRRSVLAAFVLESVLLALAGGLLGCLIALPAHGMTSAAGGANFAELAFAFAISPAALGIGMVFALLMGLAGGLLPAWRAARMPITSALREG